MEGVKLYGGDASSGDLWIKIAAHIGTRPIDACRIRYEQIKGDNHDA